MRRNYDKYEQQRFQIFCQAICKAEKYTMCAITPYMQTRPNGVMTWYEDELRVETGFTPCVIS